MSSYSPHIAQIREYKRLFRIKTKCNYIPGIFNRKSYSVLDGDIFPDDLFIVRHLYHKWHIKCFLEPSVIDIGIASALSSITIFRESRESYFVIINATK